MFVYLYGGFKIVLIMKWLDFSFPNYNKINRNKTIFMSTYGKSDSDFQNVLLDKQLNVQVDLRT